MHIRNEMQLDSITMNDDIKIQIRGAFKKKAPKYGNHKTEVDGIMFDSKREAQGYRELKILKKLQIVKSIKMQVPYQIVLNGVKICKYYSDFDVEYADGRKETIDYKGMKTPVYKLKKKLVEAQFGIKIVEK